MSESASVSEESIAIRLLTDLAVITSTIVIDREHQTKLGFAYVKDSEETAKDIKLDYKLLMAFYSQQHGLVSDRLRATLEWVWGFVKNLDGIKGIVFAYDEAQNMSDRLDDKQYPLSILLDIFQSIQRKNIPFLLLLVGLPTLFPKLVEARTYSERMFEIIE